MKTVWISGRTENVGKEITKLEEHIKAERARELSDDKMNEAELEILEEDEDALNILKVE
jgi:hypothetical protein